MVRNDIACNCILLPIVRICFLVRTHFILIALFRILIAYLLFTQIRCLPRVLANTMNLDRIANIFCSKNVFYFVRLLHIFKYTSDYF